MRAIGYSKSLPISHSESLVDIELPMPTAIGYDLLVKIKSIAVNPVDYKVRQNMPAKESEYRVLGWDAVGEVVAVGQDVSHFKLGDMVFYAGDLTRQGSNAEYQLVDERLVGIKPKSLSNAEAAALPLTTVTAWEILFEHLAIARKEITVNKVSEDVLLIVGAAGGVGSILIQLAKVLTGATIIATASQVGSQAWVTELGADYVIDHTKPLAAQIESLGLTVTHIASLRGTDSYFNSYCDLIAPFGKIALIDDPASLDVTKLKTKSLSLHWEFMFARSMYKTDKMIEQSRLLNKVSDLVDQGYIKTTLGKNLGIINAKNLKAAHAELENGRSVGKIVLEGF